MKIVFAAMTTVFLSFGYAGACSFNTDCEPGSRCVKSGGSLEGICVGGMSPGNKNDDAPIKDKDRPVWDIGKSYGNTCSFNTDCGPGYMCLKESGSIEGVCIKR